MRGCMREVVVICAVIVLGLGAYSLTTDSVEDQWERDIDNQKQFMRELYESHKRSTWKQSPR